MRQLPLNVPALRQTPAAARVEPTRDSRRPVTPAVRELSPEEMRQVGGSGPTRLPNRTW